MFWSKNIVQNIQLDLSNILGISRSSNLGKYLDLPLLKRRVTRENFVPIIDKVSTHLAF